MHVHHFKQLKNVFSSFIFLSFILTLAVYPRYTLSQDFTLERVSIRTDGGEANKASQQPVISNDSSVVAFWSAATNLVDNDTNDEPDVFIHERNSGITERISVNSAGIEGNDWSDSPAVSGDGKFIAFRSLSDNLVADTFGRGDIFVRDRLNNTTEIVSISSNGVIGDGRSANPDISANGRFVTFESTSILIDGEPDIPRLHIYLHDRQLNTTIRVSVATDGTIALGSSFASSISSDGNYIVFNSTASNLVPGVGNGAHEYIYVRDLMNNSTEVIARGTLAITEPISGDGRFITFHSDIQLVPEDDNDDLDVYIYDRETMILKLISESIDGNAGNQNSSFPTISNDGRYVAFNSLASDLVPNDTNASADAFIWDRIENSIERGALMPNGEPIDGRYTSPSISQDGTSIAFLTILSLFSNDTNSDTDVYVYSNDLNGILLSEEIFLPIVIR